MEHVVCSPRREKLTKYAVLLSLLLSSMQTFAGPADAFNIWRPVAQLLSDEEDTDVGKPGMSDVTGYSDEGIEVEGGRDTPSAKRNSYGKDYFKRNAISVNLGSVSMLDLEQSLDKVVGTECALWIFGCVYDRDIIEPLPIRFKSTPSVAWSIEYERHKSGLWSYGFEVYHSVHEYTADTLIPADGELEINRIFFALKKYFEIGSSLQPYVGVSGGLLDAKMRGAITSSYNDGGSGWSGVAGVVYQLDNITLRASYRYSESNIHIQDTFINDGLRRKTSGDISTRTEGYFAGIEIRF